MCNLTLACEPCNTKKGTQDIRDFLKHKPDLLSKILAQAKAPLKDAAAVNVTRWALYRRLQAVGLPVECGSGGLTKYNRTMRDLPKAHWIDAACVGESTPEVLKGQGVVPLLVTAQGHGSRQVTNVDRYGFPKGKPKQGGRVKGFRTGTWSKPLCRQGQSKAPTWDGYLCGAVAHLISSRKRRGWQVSAGSIVASYRGPRDIGMHHEPRCPSPEKGGPFLPR